MSKISYTGKEKIIQRIIEEINRFEDGSVEDVKVDGISVVDEDGVANIDLSGYTTDDELDNALSEYSKTTEFASVAFSGNYGDLSGGPSIPTKTSDLQNDGDGTSIFATKSYVDTAIENLPEPMIFKGTLGTGGTITTLPTASSQNEGFTYKVITDGTYASQDAKVGDVFISNGSSWVLIPSGDTDSDTWREIKINGNEFLGNAISTGAVNFKSGTNTTVSGSGHDIQIDAVVPTKTSDLTNDGEDGTNVFVADNDSRLSDSRTPKSHTHGSITNGGAITANTAIENTDRLVFVDANDSNKLKRASEAFDGSTTTKALTQKGTFESFAKAADITTAINALDGGTIGTPGTGKTLTALSQSNGNISATFSDISISKSQAGLGNVDNTSDATKKTNFTGSIASGNTGFVTGGDIYTALQGKADTGDIPTDFVKASTGGTFSGNITVAKSHTGTTDNQTILTVGNNKTSTGMSSGALKLFSEQGTGKFIRLFNDNTLTGSGADRRYKLPVDKPNDSELAVVADIPTALSDLSTDATHRVVTDTQISSWDSKAGSDVNVTQTLVSTNKNYPLLFSTRETSDTTADRTGTAQRNNSVFVNPSTGKITNGGNIQLNKRIDSTTENSSAEILLTSIYNDGESDKTSSAAIRAYTTKSTNGTNLIVNPGAAIFIGGGEAPNNHYNLNTGTSEEPVYPYRFSATERTFITSDNVIHIQANANTITARKGMLLTNNQELVPDVADTATNNVGSIGTSACKWANIYATNLNGVEIGDSPKFTDENVKQTQIEASDTGLYKLLLSDTSSGTLTGGANKTEGVSYKRSTPMLSIDSADGVAGTAKINYLKIGNETASDTAGNAQGDIRLCSSNSGYIDMRLASTTQKRVVTFPDPGSGNKTVMYQSNMSASELVTGTATTTRTVRADYLNTAIKQLIEEHEASKSCIVGSDASANLYFHVCTIKLEGLTEKTDVSVMFSVNNTFSSNTATKEGAGILYMHVRANTTSPMNESMALKFVSSVNFNNDDFKLGWGQYTTDDGTGIQYELWTKIDTRWMFRRFTILSQGYRKHGYDNIITLDSDTSGSSSLPTRIATWISAS